MWRCMDISTTLIATGVTRCGFVGSNHMLSSGKRPAPKPLWLHPCKQHFIILVDSFKLSAKGDELFEVCAKPRLMIERNTFYSILGLSV